MTNQLTKDPIKLFIDRVTKLDSKLGKEVYKFIPEWWDASLVESESAVQQLLGTIAQFFNLDLTTVLDIKNELRFNSVKCCYKKSKNKDRLELIPATSIINSASEIISDITINEFKGFFTADHIREQILGQGHDWIDSFNLITHCWKLGIPVMYIPNLPTSKKMDGIVIQTKQRPVITITKKYTHQSELLFSIAHELGHIMLHHLDKGELLIDDKLGENNSDSDIENEADKFAFHLLAGKSNISLTRYNKFTTANQLKRVVERNAKTKQVDPGHIALRWGYKNKAFPTAHSTLNKIYDKNVWVKDLKALYDVDETLVSEEKIDYLYKLLGIELD